MSDVPGIPREVIEHKFDIDPAFKPIKQKERRYTPERCETIRLEVNRLLEVGFIRLSKLASKPRSFREARRILAYVYRL
jgi:hypothetical protein